MDLTALGNFDKQLIKAVGDPVALTKQTNKIQMDEILK